MNERPQVIDIDQANDCLVAAWCPAQEDVCKGKVKTLRELRNLVYWRMSDYIRKHEALEKEKGDFQETPVSDLPEPQQSHVRRYVNGSEPLAETGP